MFLPRLAVQWLGGLGDDPQYIYFPALSLPSKSSRLLKIKYSPPAFLIAFSASFWFLLCLPLAVFTSYPMNLPSIQQIISGQPFLPVLK